MLFIVTSPLFHDLLPVISSPSYYLLPVTYHLLPITCYLLPITYYLLHLSRLIRVLTLYHKYDKLPMLLAHHAFILPLSYRHLYLFTRDKTWSHPWAAFATTVSNSYHGREQLMISVAYRENALYFFFYLLYIYLTWISSFILLIRYLSFIYNII